MKMKGFVKGSVLLMLLAMMSVTACANSDKGPRGKEQGPPPEAIKACEGKQEGDSVTFAGRGGESLSATCQSIDDQLAAVPEGHKRP
jgi:hypothetical protein